MTFATLMTKDANRPRAGVPGSITNALAGRGEGRCVEMRLVRWSGRSLDRLGRTLVGSELAQPALPAELTGEPAQRLPATFRLV